MNMMITAMYRDKVQLIVFLRIIFAIDNLLKVSFFTLLIAAMRIIIDVIRSTIVEINEFKCGYDK